MKLWQKLAALVAFGISTAVGGAAFAADGPQAGAKTFDPNSAVAKALEKDAVCTKCHDETEQRPILAMYKTRHGVRADGRTPGCQTCHGPSEAHVKNEKGTSTRPLPDRMFVGPNKSDSKVVNDTCISCHESGKRMHWQGSQHQSRDVTCTSCHQVHTHADKVLTKATQPEVCYACHKTERAQTHRISTHPIEAGKMACSDCHNPHGSTGPKLLVKNSVNETCYTCHAEKRGPFLWEHPAASDNCTNCHTPHGSNITPLLKQRTPWLCQDCHAATFHPSTAYSGRGLPPSQGGAAAAPQQLLRACTNCHSQVHGSNHPSGARFTR